MKLTLANKQDIKALLPLVRDYHKFEGINSSDTSRCKAVTPLLEPDSSHGHIWLIKDTDDLVGYIALCFGYSIEFSGRDAFIDEFYILPSARGKGVGTKVLQAIKALAADLEVAALHLEVTSNNKRAKMLYEKWFHFTRAFSSYVLPY